MERKRLLILNSYPHIGGAEKFIIGLASGLIEKGWEVYLGLRQGSSFIQEVSSYNFSLYTLPMRADFDPKTEKRLCQLHQKIHFQLIFSTDERSARLGGLFSRTRQGIVHIARLRTVWDTHQTEEFSRRIRYKINYTFFMDLIITNSVAAKKDMMERYKLPSKKINVVYNGINLPHLFNKPFTKGNFRKELNLSADAFIIAHIGRISPPKNQIEAIEVAERIFKHIPNAYLIIVGKPVNKKYFQILLERKEISQYKGRIFILGYRDDIAQIFIDSNILLSTSTAEGLLNVMIEAGFFGKPVIGRDINGNDEIISNGINGFLLPEQANVWDFAESIIRIYNNPYLAEEMGRNAQQIVQEKFSYEKMIEIYDQLFMQYLTKQKVFRKIA